MTKLLCAAVLMVAGPIGIESAAAQQATSALGEASLRPMEITCAEIMGSPEAERNNLAFFIAGYRAAMDSQAGAGAAAAGVPPSAVDVAGSVVQPTTDPTASSGASAAPAAAATAAPAPETTTPQAATTEIVDAGGDAVAGATDVAMARSFLSMKATDILKDCAGHDNQAAFTVIGTAAGWPADQQK